MQNEVHLSDAKALVGKGCRLILEGANMPTTNDAIQFFHSKGAILAPAKACNAGALGGGGGVLTTSRALDVTCHEKMFACACWVCRFSFASSSGMSLFSAWWHMHSPSTATLPLCMYVHQSAHLRRWRGCVGT